MSNFPIDALEKLSIEDAIRIVSALCSHFHIPAVHMFAQSSEGEIISVDEGEQGTLVRLSICGFPSEISEAIAAAISGGMAVSVGAHADPLALTREEAEKAVNNSQPKKVSSWGMASKRAN